MNYFPLRHKYNIKLVKNKDMLLSHIEPLNITATQHAELGLLVSLQPKQDNSCILT